jgi:hypothetical protein
MLHIESLYYGFGTELALNRHRARFLSGLVAPAQLAPE